MLLNLDFSIFLHIFTAMRKRPRFIEDNTTKKNPEIQIGERLFSLIDIDSFIIKAASIENDEDYHTCEKTLKSMIYNVLAYHPFTHVIFFLGGKNNFKKDVFKEYKQDRKRQELVHVSALYRFAYGLINSFSFDIFETDDSLSVVATYMRKNKIPHVVISYDSDLRQIPSWHLVHQKQYPNSKYKTWQTVKVDAQEAAFCFYMILLTGYSPYTTSRKNNIKGVKGIGKAKAKNYIDINERPYKEVRVIENKDGTFANEEVVINPNLEAIKKAYMDTEGNLDNYEMYYKVVKLVRQAPEGFLEKLGDLDRFSKENLFLSETL